MAVRKSKTIVRVSSSLPCRKDDGIIVTLVEGRSGKCPVCLKDEKIRNLEIRGRFLALYIVWSIDYLRITNYHGQDREARDREIEKVNSKTERPGRRNPGDTSGAGKIRGT
jgi:hypothetical protein